MTFKSTIETLSEALSEAELDGVAGGRIKQPGPERRRYCQYYLWPRAYRSHAVVLAPDLPGSLLNLERDRRRALAANWQRAFFGYETILRHSKSSLMSVNRNHSVMEAGVCPRRTLACRSPARCLPSSS